MINEALLVFLMFQLLKYSDRTLLCQFPRYMLKWMVFLDSFRIILFFIQLTRTISSFYRQVEHHGIQVLILHHMLAWKAWTWVFHLWNVTSLQQSLQHPRQKSSLHRLFQWLRTQLCTYKGLQFEKFVNQWLLKIEAPLLDEFTKIRHIFTA